MGSFSGPEAGAVGDELLHRRKLDTELSESPICPLILFLLESRVTPLFPEGVEFWEVQNVLRQRHLKGSFKLNRRDLMEFALRCLLIPS